MTKGCMIRKIFIFVFVLHELAKKDIQKLYKLFPKMTILESNHGSMVYRRAIAKGMTRSFIKSYNQIWEVGKGWEWKEKHGGIILNQLRKLGASCDWDRTAFTLDDSYQKAVLTAFVTLYKRGYIYRGLRMSNWCPVSSRPACCRHWRKRYCTPATLKG